MMESLLKIAILVAMTHGLRMLGRLAGPRRSGIILGLPSTTAIVLVGRAYESGLGDAAAMAEASFLGLVAAVTLPVAYAQAVALRWRMPWALAAAVSGYAFVACGFSFVPAIGASGCLVTSTTAVLAACLLTRHVGGAQTGRGLITPSRVRSLVLRTVVPLACPTLVMALGDATGPFGAGLLNTFPGLTLAVLIVTHLEAGPAVASHIARALPPGNLSTIAFLTAFRFGCPEIGLVWGTACGYLASLAAFLAIERLSRPVRIGVPWRIRSSHRPHPGRVPSVRAIAARPRTGTGPRSRGNRPRHPARFSPLVEALPC